MQETTTAKKVNEAFSGLSGAFYCQNPMGIGKPYEFAKYPSLSAYTLRGSLPEEYVSRAEAYEDKTQNPDGFMVEVCLRPLSLVDSHKTKVYHFFTDTLGVLQDKGDGILNTLDKMGLDRKFYTEGMNFKVLWNIIKHTVDSQIEQLMADYELELMNEQQIQSKRMKRLKQNLTEASGRAEEIEKEINYLNSNTFYKIQSYG